MLVAASSPASPAAPKAAPTHAGPVRRCVPGRSAVPSTGVTDIGGAVTTERRSTATLMEAMPRTVALPVPPQATTERAGWSDATPATSNRRRNSTLVCGGSTTWKSFSASPTNSSILDRPVGAEARPLTVTEPAKVAPGAGSSMLTTPASGPGVGQVLGMAPAGAANEADTATSMRSRRRAITSARR